MTRSLKAQLLLLLATFVWGSTFVVVKAAFQFASPLVFTAMRMALATVILALIFRKSVIHLTRPALIAGTGVGALLFLGYAFQSTGLRLTTPSKSAFLSSSSAVMVPLFLAIFWRARIHPGRIAGIFIAFAGLFLMTVPSSPGAIADLSRVNKGDVLTILAAIAFAFQIIVVGRATIRFPFQQIVTVQIGVMALLLAPSIPFGEAPHLQPSATLAAAVVACAAFPTALAFGVQAWAQQFTPAIHTALIFMLEPVFAWLTSMIVTKERLGIRSGSGALLILAGILVSQLLGGASHLESEAAARSAPG